MSDDLPPEAGFIVSAMLRGVAGLRLLFVPLVGLQGSGALLFGGRAVKSCFLIGLVLSAYSLWLCLRLRLDARLFAELAVGRTSEVSLDKALARLFGKPFRERDMADRLAGTRRLCSRLFAAAVLSLGCFALGAMIR